jgi:hypothetical protein
MVSKFFGRPDASLMTLSTDFIERGAQRRTCDAPRITQQRVADHIHSHAMLQGDAGNDSAILRGRIGAGAGLAVADENFR